MVAKGISGAAGRVETPWGCSLTVAGVENRSVVRCAPGGGIVFRNSSENPDLSRKWGVGGHFRPDFLGINNPDLRRGIFCISQIFAQPGLLWRGCMESPREWGSPFCCPRSTPSASCLSNQPNKPCTPSPLCHNSVTLGGRFCPVLEWYAFERPSTLITRIVQQK